MRTGRKTGPVADTDRVDHWLDDFSFNPASQLAHVLAMVGRPEYPAAAVVLAHLVAILLTALSSTQPSQQYPASPALKSAAVDLIGAIAARIHQGKLEANKILEQLNLLDMMSQFIDPNYLLNPSNIIRMLVPTTGYR